MSKYDNMGSNWLLKRSEDMKSMAESPDLVEEQKENYLNQIEEIENILKNRGE